MTRHSRKEVSGTGGRRSGFASECGEKRPPAVNVSTPGIVSLAVPIVLPFAVVGVLLAASLSLEEPHGLSTMPGTAVARQTLDAERSAQ